jgi:hypothetical protein
MPCVDADGATAPGSYSTPLEDALGPGEDKAKQLDAIPVANGYVAKDPS